MPAEQTLQRDRAGPADAMRASARWITTAGKREAKSEGRRPRHEEAARSDYARALPFSEQYVAWQKAAWRLGRGESPVDILQARGDTLLAAWFAGTAPPARRACSGALQVTAWRRCGPVTPCKRCATPTGSGAP